MLCCNSRASRSAHTNLGSDVRTQLNVAPHAYVYVRRTLLYRKHAHIIRTNMPTFRVPRTARIPETHRTEAFEHYGHHNCLLYCGRMRECDCATCRIRVRFHDECACRVPFSARRSCETYVYSTRQAFALIVCSALPVPVIGCTAALGLADGKVWRRVVSKWTDVWGDADVGLEHDGYAIKPTHA